MYWTVYDVRENKRTNNFFGHEIVIDGERGIDTYPGKWDYGEAKRHYMDGVPWDRPLEKETHTCTICIDGMYYALGHDTFMTTIYAIGSDRIDPKHNGMPNAVYFSGGIEERNKAIKAVCLPHCSVTAYGIARNFGIFDGQLYEK